MNKRSLATIRLAIFILLAILVCLLNRYFGWSAALTDAEELANLWAAFSESKLIVLLIYVLLTVVGCVLLALPGLIFALVAGMLFGPFWGTIACSCATTIGAALAFLAGRLLIRDAVRPWVMRNQRLRRLLFDHAEHNAMYLLMITRLVPVFPYNLQNFAYGITDIPFWTYTIYSFVFMLPGTAAFTIAAAGIGSPGNRVLYFIIAAILFAAIATACTCIHKRGKSREDQKDEQQENV